MDGEMAVKGEEGKARKVCKKAVKAAEKARWKLRRRQGGGGAINAKKATSSNGKRRNGPKLRTK